jgi:hypothetical protein
VHPSSDADYEFVAPDDCLSCEEFFCALPCGFGEWRKAQGRFGLMNLVQESSFDHCGSFIVETYVGSLFQHIQSEAQIPQHLNSVGWISHIW